jgi:uncharacterized protein (DUF2141 family)
MKTQIRLQSLTRWSVGLMAWLWLGHVAAWAQQPTATIGSQTNVACFGQNTGSFTVVASGGAGGPYLFQLQPNANSQTGGTFSGLAAGTYTVTVFDANSNSTNVTATITQPSAALATTIQVSGGSCTFTPNTCLNAVPTGGTPPYTYIWSNGTTQASVCNLNPVLTYNVNVTDANGCIATASISAASLATTQAVSQTLTSGNATCPTCPDGSITSVASGGFVPYKWQINGGALSNGQTSPTFSFNSLLPGTYTVTVQDNIGCTNSQTITVNSQGSALSATISSTTNVLCHGASTGQIVVNPSGGTAPYTITAQANGQTFTASPTGVLSNLPAGSYVIVVQDATGQAFTLTGVISQPAQPITSAISKTDATCGQNNGSAVLTVSGGTPGYQVVWQPGNLFGTSISNLAPGKYVAQIFDANQCVKVDSVVIGNVGAPVVTANQTNPTCAGVSNGSITLAVSGGTAPYTYAWTGPNNFTSNSQNLTNRPAGSYVVVVSSANGCTASATVVLTAPQVLVSGSASPTSGPGQSNGSLTLTASGGAAPYQYSFDGGLTFTPNSTASGLAAGNYAVQVRDANNCLSDLVNLTVPQGTGNQVVLTAQVTQPQCANQGGSVVATAANGTAPYTFTLTNSQTGAVLTSQTGNFTNVPVGQYQVKVQDAAGASATQNITLAPANPVVVSVTVNQPPCGQNTGSAVIQVSGGTPGYQILVQGGGQTFTPNPNGVVSNLAPGTYFVQAFDASQCSDADSFVVAASSGPIAVNTFQNASCPTCADGSIAVQASGNFPMTYQLPGAAPQNSPQFGNLLPGTYCITVTDANGCTVSTCATIGVSTPALVATIVNQQNPICHGQPSGAVQVVAANGLPPYSYVLQNSAAGIVDSNTTGLFANLPAGNYVILVLDAQNQAFTLTAVLTQPAPLNVQANIIKPGCTVANGSISLQAFGGTAPYFVQWFGPQGSLGSGPLANTPLTGIGTGKYVAIISDQNQCQRVDSFVVNPQTPWQVNGVVTPAGCANANAGSINLTIAGGTPNFIYSYQWSNGATTQDLFNIAAGVYTVVVSDNTGCTQTLTYTVTGGNTGTVSTINVVPATCNTCANGAFEIAILGGTPPYTIQLNNQAADTFNTAFNGLTPGTYVVSVLDAAGCLVTHTVVVPVGQNSQLTAVLDSVQNVSCHNGQNGSFFVHAQGGNPPYIYSIGNGAVQNTGNFFNLAAGTYSVLVKDATGAQVVLSVTLTQPNPLQVAASATGVSCQGGLDGQILTAVGGGTPPYTYQWTTGSVAPNVFGVAAGSYTVIVSDANSCQTSATIQVGVNPNPECIWPGDANADGIANNLDVYALGLAFGSQGPVRPNASTNWTGQFGFPWQGFLPSGVNFKHADADGNGKIDTLDFAVVNLNYGLTHNKTSDSTAGPLTVLSPADTLEQNTPVRFEIHLGSEAEPVADAYTVAFSLEYDPQAIVPGSVRISNSNSWFGLPVVEQYALAKDFADEGRLDVGLTRVNQVNVSGYGRIIYVDVITDNISGKVANTYYPLDLKLRNVVLFALDGTTRAIGSVDRRVFIRGDEQTNSRPEALNTQVLLVPNPANSVFSVRTVNGLAVTGVEVVDALGRTVVRSAQAENIPVAQLPTGVYQVRVATAQGTALQRLVVR